ncbi:arylsulfatase [Prosthecobacter sp.]|uniref:arylsulfatase n=1 Tax=Prosthecobacter sp. TaxID=1965333 RepID=UPI001D2794DB|nr:arylsulfatase [Prosthecobacter sp.]MCB1279455.1 arylsulfatase [Prosthecobacter sp.]
MKHLFLLLALALTAQARQPNIVFILADDLGPGDLGCYGQKIIQTPNIDRMAAEGMKFTQHYCGNAVCAPSRCVLMTGLHPGHAFIRDNRQADDAKGIKIVGKPEHEGQFPIPSDTITVAEILKSAGYTTGGFGKWGLGGPTSSGAPLKQGFDRWFGYLCQGVAHNFYPTYLWDDAKTVDLNNPPFSAHDTFRPDEDPTKPESYKRFQGNEYSADLIAEQALKFARENKDKPFFLYWPTTVPHVALQVPDDSLNEYVGKFDDPPYKGGNGYIPHFRPKAAYAAMITRMDREIGRMMALISELGLDDDTIFVFVSDNGPVNGTHQGLAGTDCAFFNSNEGRRDGKGTLYEGGFRSPCIVRWKGKIKAGTISDRITGFEDWMPTLAELVGSKDQTPRTDGISFAPTLLGEKQPAREFLYREFHGYGGQQILRMGEWKLVRRNLAAKPKAKAKASAVTEELFNITADPAETKDVAADRPDLVAKMKKIMDTQHTNSADFSMTALDK